MKKIEILSIKIMQIILHILNSLFRRKKKWLGLVTLKMKWRHDIRLIKLVMDNLLLKLTEVSSFIKVLTFINFIDIKFINTRLTNDYTLNQILISTCNFKANIINLDLIRDS